MITMYENETYLFRHVCSVNAVDFSSPHLCSTKSHDGGVEIWYWTEADMCILQTPSPKPTKIPARLNSLRTISTYGFSVRSLSCSHRPWLLLRLAGAKRGVHANRLFHNRTQWSQDSDHCSGSSQEVRPEEDSQGHQEEIRYVL